MLWDLEFEKVRLPHDADLVIARVAEFGTDEAVSWLRETFSPSEVGEALERRAHHLSKRTRDLWRVLLSKEEDWCLTIPSRPLRGTFFRP
jgi:hypothetical protein